ncbi:hypothetical protein SETIT_3G296800v2 [Setaria italica]|uniref:Uncharacterized protein n=1 Tax=Setaria italica TaxID=4555 RepID=A0A368QKG6_SETIT|nr:hypothetical protein SETIT_3G296800v2 [Setaria italica]
MNEGPSSISAASCTRRSFDRIAAARVLPAALLHLPRRLASTRRLALSPSPPLPFPTGNPHPSTPYSSNRRTSKAINGAGRSLCLLAPQLPPSAYKIERPSSDAAAATFAPAPAAAPPSSTARILFLSAAATRTNSGHRHSGRRRPAPAPWPGAPPPLQPAPFAPPGPAASRRQELFPTVNRMK